jgi:hypothetical protein
MSSFQAADFGQFMVEGPVTREVFDRLKEARLVYRELADEAAEEGEGHASLFGRIDPDEDWVEIASFQFREDEEEEDEEEEDEDDEDEDDEDEDEDLDEDDDEDE